MSLFDWAVLALSTARYCRVMNENQPPYYRVIHTGLFNAATTLAFWAGIALLVWGRSYLGGADAGIALLIGFLGGVMPAALSGRFLELVGYATTLAGLVLGAVVVLGH